MKINNSLIKIYKYIKNNEQKLFAIFIVFTIAEVLYSILNIIISKVMVEILYFDKEKINYFIATFLFFLVSMCLLGYLKTITLNLGNTKITKIKNHYKKKLCNRITNLKYEYIEDADFLNSNNLTFSVVDKYDGGIEGVCHILFSFPAKFILCIIFVGILGQMNLIIIFAILIDWISRVKIYKIFSNKMYSKRQDLGDSKRHMNYYYQISNDFNFGKDIRIFNIGKKILNDYINEIKSYINTLKKIYKIKFKLENLDIIFGMISDFIIISILILNVLCRKVSVSEFTMYITIINMLKEFLKTMSEDISTLLCELPYLDDFFKIIENTDLIEQKNHTK